MPRSRSRSPRARRDRSSDRRHRSRREEKGGDRERNRDRDQDRDRRRRRDEGGRDEGGRKEREREREQGRERESEKRSSREKDPEPKPDERIARRLKAASASTGTPATGANADGAEPAAAAPVEKEVPNFAPTGLLAAATNTVNGTVLKYTEPADSRKPPGSQRWRLFVFKDSEILTTHDLNTSSCWLIGRDRAVADLPVDHPSCSKQHAVVQFRYVMKTGEYGEKEGAVRPYVLDLESANGTRVGGAEVPPRRYLELKEGDLITFGLSTREYILMLEKD